jgi:hypothetical protein
LTTFEPLKSFCFAIKKVKAFDFVPHMWYNKHVIKSLQNNAVRRQGQRRKIMKLYYGEKLLGDITTNHSMSIEDAAEILDIDLTALDENDEPVYDYDLFRMEW